jgi:hypothetical protein
LFQSTTPALARKSSIVTKDSAAEQAEKDKALNDEAAVIF